MQTRLRKMKEQPMVLRSSKKPAKVLSSPTSDEIHRRKGRSLRVETPTKSRLSAGSEPESPQNTSKANVSAVESVDSFLSESENPEKREADRMDEKRDVFPPKELIAEGSNSKKETVPEDTLDIFGTDNDGKEYLEQSGVSLSSFIDAGDADNTEMAHSASDENIFNQAMDKNEKIIETDPVDNFCEDTDLVDTILNSSGLALRNPSVFDDLAQNDNIGQEFDAFEKRVLSSDLVDDQNEKTSNDTTNGDTVTQTQGEDISEINIMNPEPIASNVSDLLPENDQDPQNATNIADQEMESDKVLVQLDESACKQFSSKMTSIFLGTPKYHYAFTHGNITTTGDENNDENEHPAEHSPSDIHKSVPEILVNDAMGGTTTIIGTLESRSFENPNLDDHMAGDGREDNQNSAFDSYLDEQKCSVGRIKFSQLLPRDIFAKFKEFHHPNLPKKIAMNSFGDTIDKTISNYSYFPHPNMMGMEQVDNILIQTRTLHTRRIFDKHIFRFSSERNGFHDDLSAPSTKTSHEKYDAPSTIAKHRKKRKASSEVIFEGKVRKSLPADRDLSEDMDVMLLRLIPLSSAVIDNDWSIIRESIGKPTRRGMRKVQPAEKFVFTNVQTKEDRKKEAMADLAKALDVSKAVPTLVSTGTDPIRLEKYEITDEELPSVISKIIGEQNRLSNHFSRPNPPSFYKLNTDMSKRSLDSWKTGCRHIAIAYYITQHKKLLRKHEVSVPRFMTSMKGAPSIIQNVRAETSRTEATAPFQVPGNSAVDRQHNDRPMLTLPMQANPHLSGFVSGPYESGGLNHSPFMGFGAQGIPSESIQANTKKSDAPNATPAQQKQQSAPSSRKGKGKSNQKGSTPN